MLSSQLCNMSQIWNGAAHWAPFLLSLFFLTSCSSTLSHTSCAKQLLQLICKMQIRSAAVSPVHRAPPVFLPLTPGSMHQFSVALNTRKMLSLFGWCLNVAGCFTVQQKGLHLESRLGPERSSPTEATKRAPQAGSVDKCVQDRINVLVLGGQRQQLWCVYWLIN